VILYTALIVFITLGTFPISVSAFASNDQEVNQDISVKIQKTTEQTKVIHEQDILVLHLTDNASGADALSQITEHFRARGYKLTKLSEYVPER
jgi:uncharacterized protein YtpQ (UPF0354 family)